MQPYNYCYGAPKENSKDIGASSGGFFYGLPIDPNFIIQQFQSLLKKGKGAKTLSSPSAASGEAQTVQATQGAGFMSKPSVKAILEKGGKTKADIDAFIKDKGAYRISVSDNNSEKRVKAVMDAFGKWEKARAVLGKEELKEEEAKEREALAKEEADAKKAAEKTEKDVIESENEASRDHLLLKQKTERLTERLKQDFGFTGDTKLPKGLLVDFLSEIPDQEGDVIEKYRPQLEALQVKEEEMKERGKERKELEDAKMLQNAAALVAKRARLKKKVSQMAKANVPAVSPPEAARTLAKNPRGKIKLTKGRGKNSSNIDPIKILI